MELTASDKEDAVCLLVLTETVRKLPVTLCQNTGRVSAIALNGTLVFVFKKVVTERLCFCFLSPKEEKGCRFHWGEAKSWNNFSPVASTILRPHLVEIVQCMTQMNAFHCTSVPLAPYKSDPSRLTERLIDKVGILEGISLCCPSAVDIVRQWTSSSPDPRCKHLCTPLWQVVASLASVNTVCFSL